MKTKLKIKKKKIRTAVLHRLKNIHGELKRKNLERKEKKTRKGIDELNKFIKRAQRLFDLKQYKESEEEYWQALNYAELHDKEQANDILHHIGLCKYNQGDFENAIIFFKKASKGKDDDQSLYLRALSYISRCDLGNTEPLDKLKKKIRKLGDKLWDMHRDGTKERYRKDFDKMYAEKEKHKMHLKFMQKDLPEAEKLLKEAAKIAKEKKKPNPDYLYYLGICYYFMSNVRAAIDMFTAVLLIDPNYIVSSIFKIPLFEDIRRTQGGTEFESIENEKFKAEKKYKSKRGVYVRSKSEVLIDNLFFDYNIRAEYEPTVVIHGKKLCPDWHLPDIDVFIEYAGMDSPDYLKSLEWKKELFESDGKKLIIIDKENDDDLMGAVKEKLSEYIKFD